MTEYITWSEAAKDPFVFSPGTAEVTVAESSFLCYLLFIVFLF